MRSSLKLPYINPLFFTNFYNKKIKIITNIRNSLIPLNFLNKQIIVYNGNKYKNLPLMSSNIIIKHRLGEFSLTKSSITRFVHIKKTKKKIKKI
jgi:ribosomal protein S19